MEQPDEEPTEKPTNTTQEAETEGAWMSRNWIAIASVSILGLVLLVLGLMQVTGLIDLFSPFVETAVGQWIGFGIIVLGALILAIWGWRSVVASTSN